MRCVFLSSNSSSSSSKVNHFDYLPKELGLEIFSHLPLIDRLQVARVSKLFMAWARDEEFIKTEYREKIDSNEGSIKKITDILKDAKDIGIDLTNVTFENLKKIKRKVEGIKKDSIIEIWVWRMKVLYPRLVGYPSRADLEGKECSEVIEKFDNWLENNKDTITSLNLEMLGLPYLPSSIRNLSNLTTLNLSYNCFAFLPAFIGELSSLKQLNIKRNPLKPIPSSILKLKKKSLCNQT